eukprot:scaffold68423_cov73-Phaeocystis_antarctica.AAC.2
MCEPCRATSPCSGSTRCTFSAAPATSRCTSSQSTPSGAHTRSSSATFCSRRRFASAVGVMIPMRSGRGFLGGERSVRRVSSPSSEGCAPCMALRPPSKTSRVVGASAPPPSTAASSAARTPLCTEPPPVVGGAATSRGFDGPLERGRAWRSSGGARRWSEAEAQKRSRRSRQNRRVAGHSSRIRDEPASSRASGCGWLLSG